MLANIVRMAYIDSKLFSIRSARSETTSVPPPEDSQHTDEPDTSTATLESGIQQTQSRPATDLPEQQRPKNSATTQAAGAQAAHSNPKPKPPRLGRDGKPLRPRKDRNRRTSFDIARDAMVEQVLRESRLDIYEGAVAQPPPTNTRAGLDEDADDRMAEEFRRNFLAAQEERKVRKPQLPPSGKGDPARGPKLGGSRSQRAAMRAMEEAKAKQK